MPYQLIRPIAAPSRMTWRVTESRSTPSGNTALSASGLRSNAPRERLTPASATVPRVSAICDGARSASARSMASTMPVTVASKVTGLKPSVVRSTIRCPEVPPGATWVCEAPMSTLPSWYVSPKRACRRRMTSNWMDWNISPMSAVTWATRPPLPSSKTKARANCRCRSPEVCCSSTA